MRKLAIAVALASTALASPAFARDDAWYVGIEGGASIAEDQDFDVSGVNNNANADLKSAWDIDGIVGYDFGSFRLEAEIGYKRAQLTQWSSLVSTPAGAAATARPAGTYPDAGGPATNLSFMMNGLVDFGDDEGLNGFVGGGLGVAQTKVSYSIDGSGPGFLADSDTGLAWQAIAGVRTALSSNVDVGVKYRFFDQPGVDLVDRIGRTSNSRYRSHSLLASLIFNF
ncbi:MAG: hypothetical protein RLZZ561_1690, partial [Pseudomonadota bacterium]